MMMEKVDALVGRRGGVYGCWLRCHLGGKAMSSFEIFINLLNWDLSRYIATAISPQCKHSLPNSDLYFTPAAKFLSQ